MPNKATGEIKTFARSLLEDAVYRARLKQRIINGKAPQIEALLYAHAYGKPRMVSEHNEEEGTWVTDAEMQRAADECTRLLERYISRAPVQEESREGEKTDQT